jgi:ribonucleotide monophosphatase NagD (HAD superfamily)
MTAIAQGHSAGRRRCCGAGADHRRGPGSCRAKAAGLRCLLVSNAGPTADLQRKVPPAGLDLEPADIYSVNNLAGPFIARTAVPCWSSATGCSSPRWRRAAVTDAAAWLAERGAPGGMATPDDLRLLEQADFDAVLIGIDVTVDYIKLCLACVLVQRGALLIGANPDYSFPFEGGMLLPGNGSIVSLVAAVCGVEPLYLGKPTLHLFEHIRQETGFSAGELVMVGDRPETDYEFARRAGLYCYLVRTGVTPAERMPADGRDVKVLPTLDEVARELRI